MLVVSIATNFMVGQDGLILDYDWPTSLEAQCVGLHKSAHFRYLAPKVEARGVRGRFIFAFDVVKGTEKHATKKERCRLGPANGRD